MTATSTTDPTAAEAAAVLSRELDDFTVRQGHIRSERTQLLLAVARCEERLKRIEAEAEATVHLHTIRLLEQVAV